MTIHDISVDLSRATVTWPGDPPFAHTTLNHTDGVTLSTFSGGSHSGTHIDAPSHYLRDAHHVNNIPLEHFYGPAVLIDARGEKAITADHVTEQLTEHDQRVLFKTDNSERPDFFTTFHEDYVCLTLQAAEVLAQRNMLLVGIDAFSVDRFDSTDAPCHRLLLGAGVVILETLDLRHVAPGRYTLSCGPLKITDTEAAPCRAVLIDET